MKKNKIKNPLMRRIPKELRSDWKKYLVVGVFLILTIGFVSGMYVANGSMLKAANEGVERYKLESGHFELSNPADEELVRAIESGEKADVKQYYLDKAREELDKKLEEEYGEYKEAYPELYESAYEEAWNGIQDKIEEEYADAEKKYELDDPDFQPVPVQVYENFYKNVDEDHNQDAVTDGTVRVYAQTEEINLACIMEGKLPETENEIAVDRMHADNVGIKVGDTITVGGESYHVVGLIAYVNYATLHEKSTDLMFDALKFNVAMVTKQGFERLHSATHYAYAWRYEEEPEDEKAEKHLSDDFLKVLLTQAVTADNEIEDYMPRYANPAINFATEDMGSDEAMGGVLLDILIVIIAFIFAVTITNMIAKESQTIGTLRASGYTRAELVAHYLSMPVIVTLISAVIGNVLGYTVFKNVVVSMYYNSYSLPTYETVWNPEAFYKTTLIPIALMLIVNLVVIIRMMRHTPLQFLRHDLKRSKRKKAVRLPRWSFFHRFRMRIIMQNVPNYLILFVGIFFIMIMLAMAVGMPSTLNYYEEHAKDMMFAKYQYILTSDEDEDGNVITTDTPGAEQFSMYSLIRKSSALDEEISVYGISDNSVYVKIDGLNELSGNEVYISESFSEKYGLAIGDTFLLDEKYENKQYEFCVAGTYDKSQSIAVFLPIDNYRTVFKQDADAFSGYLSDTQITDIDQDQIATVITERDITKMCDQLEHSMGSYMDYFQILCILLSAVLIYLLTKIIIEKNENAISMTKILGYENGEIARLYLLSTTIMVIIFNAVSVFLGAYVMNVAWRVILSTYSGWFAFVMEPVGYVKMFTFVLIGYLFVMCLDFRRIKKIPMDEALKNVQ